MIQFGSTRVLGPFSGEPISDVGSHMGKSHSVWVSGLRSVLPSLIQPNPLPFTSAHNSSQTTLALTPVSYTHLTLPTKRIV